MTSYWTVKLTESHEPQLDKISVKISRLAIIFSVVFYWF